LVVTFTFLIYGFFFSRLPLNLLSGTLHGVSAFMGKCGALLSTVVFGMVTTETIFLICGVVGLLGAVLTVLFSVDMTHVSLSEHDVQLGKYRAECDIYRIRLCSGCWLLLSSKRVRCILVQDLSCITLLNTYQYTKIIFFCF
jgi:hypothetical protein